MKINTAPLFTFSATVSWSGALVIPRPLDVKMKDKIHKIEVTNWPKEKKWLLILIPNIIAIFSLILAWRALNTTKEQFKLTNQGYLHVTPHMMPGMESKKELLLKIKYISPDTRIDYLSPKVILENVGNIPLKYEVKLLDTYINNILCSEPIEEGSGIGILYPKQKLNFNRASVSFEKIQQQSITYSELKELSVRNILKIEYHSVNAPKGIKYINREFSWKFRDNMYSAQWEKFEDKF